MAAPLNNLCKKNRDWQWRGEKQKSFEQLKISLQEAPVLKLAETRELYQVKQTVQERQ
jgi:hypothetical protein